MPAQAFTGPAPRGGPESRLRARALVVDDDGACARLVSLILKDAGIAAVTARDGIEALRKLDQVTPDVIILDLEMPNMDGRTFYHELRARGVTAPVLILSAYNPRGARRELQAQAYLDKPFMSEDLTGLVESLLDGHPQG